MTQLLPFTLAEPIFAPLASMRIGLIHSPSTGNCGDRMIERAAEQILTAFGLQWRVVEPARPADADVLLLFGGGNYGHPYCSAEQAIRRAALTTGIPCVLLPQTVYGVEIHPREWAVAWTRDQTSQRLLYGSRLAPDLAMFYTPQRPIEPWTYQEPCLSFTTAYEGLWPGRGPDLRHLYKYPEDYIAHIAKHSEVITDCLHVAIAGLIARRKVTLLPTKLHKNRSVYETWLHDLGCDWSEVPP